MTEGNMNDDGVHPAQGRITPGYLATLLPDCKSHLLFWPLAAAGLFLDLYTKKVAFDRLGQNEAYPVIDGLLRLVRAENDGAAFGLFSGKSFFLTAVSCVAIVAILGMFFFGANKRKLVNVALALFAAGVCGNLYDRAFNGGVVRDFVDLYYRSYHWHTFNMADALLCAGVGLLMISTLFTEQPVRKHDPRRK